MSVCAHLFKKRNWVTGFHQINHHLITYLCIVNLYHKLNIVKYSNLYGYVQQVSLLMLRFIYPPLYQIHYLIVVMMIYDITCDTSSKSSSYNIHNVSSFFAISKNFTYIALHDFLKNRMSEGEFIGHIVLVKTDCVTKFSWLWTS